MLLAQQTNSNVAVELSMTEVRKYQNNDFGHFRRLEQQIDTCF